MNITVITRRKAAELVKPDAHELVEHIQYTRVTQLQKI